MYTRNKLSEILIQKSFKIKLCTDRSEEALASIAGLLSQHHGVWGPTARPRVKLSVKTLQKQHVCETNWLIITAISAAN